MTISTRPGRRSATRNWRMSGCDRPSSTANGTTPFDPAQRPTEVVKVIRGRPLIRWDSVEGHLKGFRGSPAFQRFLALVAPYFNQIEEMEHYEPTGIELAKEQ